MKKEWPEGNLSPELQEGLKLVDNYFKTIRKAQVKVRQIQDSLSKHESEILLEYLGQQFLLDLKKP